jgi:hypothetical protein
VQDQTQPTVQIACPLISYQTIYLIQITWKQCGVSLRYSKITERVKVNEHTFCKLQISAIVFAVSAARFRSDEYMAAGLASLDSR